MLSISNFFTIDYSLDALAIFCVIFILINFTLYLLYDLYKSFRGK